MIILIVDLPSGEQKEILVREGGAYHGAGTLIWDERINGALPAITLGGMVKSGNTLIFDQTRKDQHDAVISAQQAAEQAKTDKAAMLDTIRQEVLADPEVIAIRDMNGAEIAAHFATRTTVAELRDDVIKLTKILVLLAEGK